MSVTAEGIVEPTNFPVRSELASRMPSRASRSLLSPNRDELMLLDELAITLMTMLERICRPDRIITEATNHALHGERGLLSTMISTRKIDWGISPAKTAHVARRTDRIRL